LNWVVRLPLGTGEVVILWWRATHISLLPAECSPLLLVSSGQPYRTRMPNLADACPSRPRQHVSHSSIFQGLPCLSRTDSHSHHTIPHTSKDRKTPSPYLAIHIRSAHSPFAPLSYDRRHHATCRSVEAAWGFAGSVPLPDLAAGWSSINAAQGRSLEGCRLEKVVCLPCG
jgi:hypothetical protein